MKPIVMLELAVQAAAILLAVWTVLFKRQADGSKPAWPGLIIVLAIVAGTSIGIADKHAGQPGADILTFGAPLLLGMAIMAALIALRLKRGLD